MTMLEKDIEKNLRRKIYQLGGFCLKWICPGWAGVPDRICLLPGGRVVFVELKRPDGDLAARQKWWGDKLDSLGFDYWTIWSNQDVDDLVGWLLSLKNGG